MIEEIKKVEGYYQFRYYMEPPETLSNEDIVKLPINKELEDNTKVMYRVGNSQIFLGYVYSKFAVRKYFCTSFYTVVLNAFKELVGDSLENDEYYKFLDSSTLSGYIVSKEKFKEFCSLDALSVSNYEKVEVYKTNSIGKLSFVLGDRTILGYTIKKVPKYIESYLD